MNEDREEAKLRELFRDLKTHDARHAPRFDAMTRAQTAPVALSPWLLRAAAAVLLIVALGVGVSRWRSARPAVPVAAVRPPASAAPMVFTLGDWQAPTDVLLELPGTGWWSTTPSFDTEVLDITASRLLEAPTLDGTQTGEDAV